MRLLMNTCPPRQLIALLGSLAWPVVRREATASRASFPSARARSDLVDESWSGSLQRCGGTQ